MIRETLSAARDLGRLHEISMVLIRWGFGDVVRRIGLSHTLEKAGKALNWNDVELMADSEPPERVCRALQDLGPTFVKLGQLLGSRVDMFSPEWIQAFEQLQDQVKSVEWEDLLPQLEEDLGDSPENIFNNIHKEPFAAASIAQVHLAELKTGEKVVLKIRRPNIEKRIEADLRLLRRFSELTENSTPELRRFKPAEIVRQFSLSLRRELDLEGECRHAERIAENLKHLPKIVIPKVYWQYCTTRLNVQHFIEGVRGSDSQGLIDNNIDVKSIANIGSEAVMHMVLINGFFHADPHPGNLICMSDTRLGLIDFGMVGRLSESRRDELVQLLFALINKDSMGVIDILMDWVPDKAVDENALSLEMDAFLDHYHGRSLKQLHFDQLLTDLTSILREHELTLPPDLAILFKTLISLDGVGRKFDPDFNIVEIASPLLSQLMKKKMFPIEIFRRGVKEGTEVFSLLNSLPYDVKKLIKSVKRNGVQVNVEVRRLDHFGHQMDRAASRITIGLVIAALIIGTAIVSSIENQPTVMGLPAWGFWGFIAASVWGIFLLLSMWRGNKDQ